MGSPQIEVRPGALPERLPRASAVAVGMRAGSTGARAARGSADLARLAGLDVPALAASEHAGGKAGDVTRIPATGERGPAYLVGVGSGTPDELRRAAASLVRTVRHADRLITSLGAGSPGPVIQALVEGLVLGGYRVPRSGITKAPEGAVPRVELVGGHDAEAVRRGLASAGASVLARDLANTPSSTKGPQWLAGQAVRVADRAGLERQVWSERDLRRDGFGGLLVVGAGAARGPRLVRLDYRPSGPVRGPHVVLVGKGITFDSGGISLKPRTAMVGMQTDMTGSAVVLAVLQACRAVGVGVRVSGLMAIAENAFGADSYRPGDIVRTYDGTTVEVTNTDAEGRMVLADAMGYARLRLRPDVMVDIATLTGAASQALGRTHAAMYATDDRLSAALVAAGRDSGELVWPMPLVEDYRALIDSDLADVRQMTSWAKGGAGSIIAALVLREFAGDVPWAHLDIAGPGRSERDKGITNRGGTGWGARLLLAWLASL